MFAVRKIDQAEALFEQVLDGLEEGVAVFDAQGAVLVSNGRFAQLLGIDSREAEDLRTLEDAIQACAPNASDPESFRQLWMETAQGDGRSPQQELAMERPVRQVLERTARPLLDGRGNSAGRVEFYRETAARRLFESKMLQAEKLAALGQRVTRIIHELNNPLTAILGQAQRILSRESGNPGREEVQQILEQAERACSIARQLLSVSREARPERRLLFLNELAERTVELHRSSLNGGGLEIRLDTAGEQPRVEGDYGLLQQVLINLLQNAQQAIELSGMGDTVGVRTRVEEGGRVRLEVWDNGPGIPVDARSRVFDPFFTTKPAGVGTGLGLAIVSAIVRQHGGSVTLDCPREGGARFLVDLPAAAEEAAPQEHPKPAVALRAAPVFPGKASAGTQPGAAPRILVVEDEPTVANLIADVLREEGMHVEVFADGQAGFEAVQRNAYDLTICDLQMPGMDGRTFYAKLLQSRNAARERFLCVTGDVMASRTHEFLEKHGLPHLAKPFRVEELSAAVREMLGEKSRAAAP